MGPRRLLAPLIVAILASACLGKNDPTPTDPGDKAPSAMDGWAERALAFTSGHDHRDPTQHLNFTTPNFEVIGWDPLVTAHYGTSAGGYFCGDTREKGGRRLGVIHSWVSDVAAVIMDLTDAAKPKKLGELVVENAHVYDVAMTPDQNYVLLATDAGGLGPSGGLASAAPGVVVSFRNACTGEPRLVPGPEDMLPLQEGVVLVDIKDPMNPKIVDYVFLAGGHSIQVQDMNGKIYVLVTTNSFSVLEVQNTANGGKLVPVTSFTGCPTNSVTCGYHDGALQIHPVTKKPLAYIGDDSTLVVFDMTDPNVPKLVSTWNGWTQVGSAITPRFIHEILPMETTWDGKHYTFLGEECGGRQMYMPTCTIVVLDTTDPAHPTALGGWTLPVDVKWSGGFLFSLHYIAVSNGTLFVSNYHGGLWAVNVSTPAAMKNMTTIGVFVPTNVSAQPPPADTSFGYTPVILDVNVFSDGTIVTWDGTSGVYTLRFDATKSPPPPKPWNLNDKSHT